MRRVVVTGLGAVPPLGIGVDATWTALVAGKSGVRNITRFDVSDYPVRFAATVDEIDPAGHLDPKERRRMSPFQQAAVVAADARMAIGKLDVWDGPFASIAEATKRDLTPAVKLSLFEDSSEDPLVSARSSFP